MATKTIKSTKAVKNVKEAGEKAAKTVKEVSEKAAKTAKKTGEKAAKAAGEVTQAMGEAAAKAAVKAKEGIVAFGSSVASKSKEIMEVAKLNTQKSAKQKELEEAYKQLGEMAYTKGRLRGDMAEEGKKIKQLYTDLQQIEVAINCAQSTKECKNCGQRNHVGDNYCSNCGTKQ